MHPNAEPLAGVLRKHGVRSHLLHRRSLWLLALSGVLVGSCVNVPFGRWCPLSGHPEPIDANCLRRHDVERYLIQLDQAVHQAWKLPADFNEDAYVQVRFVLTLEGTVSDSCISRSSNSQLAKSTLEALDAASPFPPIPHLARCIAGKEIVRHVYSAEHPVGNR